MEKVNPTKILYIKLGSGGQFSKECVDKNIIKLDYRQLNHKKCQNRLWISVMRDIEQQYRTARGATSNHLRQIREFYEADENTLWITFYARRLYWCFADNEVFLNKDGTKYRKVIGKWQTNHKFEISNLSGELARTESYRGTICNINKDVKNYLVRKINGEDLPDVKLAEESFNKLCNDIVPIINQLNPKDFEILVDMIFRNSGWQRVDVLGGNMAIIDLDLINPVTAERAAVQIKSASSQAEFNDYLDEFSALSHDKFFYIVNQPGNIKNNRGKKVILYFTADVAKLVINAGLFHWLISKF